ncbi:hypothetical protein ACKGEP_006372, partial [Pseudomonas aeruginosa]
MELRLFIRPTVHRRHAVVQQGHAERENRETDLQGIQQHLPNVFFRDTILLTCQRSLQYLHVGNVGKVVLQVPQPVFSP